VMPQLLDAGNPTLLVALRDRATVDRAWLDLAGLRSLKVASDASFCVFAFAPTSEGAYSRMFAPEYGIPEDPASGSSTGPLAAFMMRNFFTGVAYSLYEAAVLDGASTWKVFWRIYMPVSLTALAAIFILEFTIIWNELLLGLTLTQTASVRPIMASLTTLQSAYAGTTVPVILAAGLLVSLPTVAVFLATQRLFARGLSLGQL